MPEDDFFQGRSLAKAKAMKNLPAEPAPARAPLPPEARGRMVDVSSKPAVPREAVAEGFLRLRKETMAAMRRAQDGEDPSAGAPSAPQLPKGDPFPAAQVAGILAAKRTPELVPFCHPISLASVDVALAREAEGVRARATVRATAPTGVEMEALAAVAGALLTVWDMAKALEKDATGNYPATAIEGVRVVSKTKGPAP